MSLSLCAFCQQAIDPEKAVFFDQAGRVWHAGCPTAPPPLVAPVRLLLALFTPEQIEFDCEERPPGRPRCGVCWADRVTLALEALQVSLNLSEIGAPKPRRSKPLLELVRAVANQVFSDTSSTSTSADRQPCICPHQHGGAPCKCVHYHLVGGARVPAPPPRPPRSCSDGCGGLVDHEGTSARCRACQRKADLIASDALVAKIEAERQLRSPFKPPARLEARDLGGGNYWRRYYSAALAEKAIAATRRCYCGRPGELCQWCQRDHASGRPVDVVRCGGHQLAHQRSHLEGTTEELGPVVTLSVVVPPGRN